ncbi:hypothetical protein RND71_012248 [Anisodus tanguticus]|uniref:Uncharacterized protein n=1 Tax=Anisodus tanguticus TaxID=243964 RepID=A0AAE1VLL7_9SOLA|nr:hypothetical protein RND71_012248 [Anisodus tanguticus]
MANLLEGDIELLKFSEALLGFVHSSELIIAKAPSLEPRGNESSLVDNISSLPVSPNPTYFTPFNRDQAPLFPEGSTLPKKRSIHFGGTMLDLLTQRVRRCYSKLDIGSMSLKEIRYASRKARADTRRQVKGFSEKFVLTLISLLTLKDT